MTEENLEQRANKLPDHTVILSGYQESQKAYVEWQELNKEWREVWQKWDEAAGNWQELYQTYRLKQTYYKPRQGKK